jgi:hypothetical protein
MDNYFIIHDTETDSVSIINYEPNVPEGVKVLTITNVEKQGIDSGSHYFNKQEQKVVRKTGAQVQAEDNAKSVQQTNAHNKEFLTKTDWKVLRHIREKALSKPTTLTEQEYIQLEKDRERAASLIK